RDRVPHPRRRAAAAGGRPWGGQEQRMGRRDQLPADQLAVRAAPADPADQQRPAEGAVGQPRRAGRLPPDRDDRPWGAPGCRPPPGRCGMSGEMEPGIRRRLGRNPDMGRIRFGGETLDELFARIDAEFRARLRFYEGGVIADTRWYGWRLDPANLELVLVDSTGWRTYALPLTRCNQSAQVLDWLVQV